MSTKYNENRAFAPKRPQWHSTIGQHFKCLDRRFVTLRINGIFYADQPTTKLTLLPFNPPTENRYPYVARGGSWIDTPEKCRSAARRFSDKQWLKLDPQRPQSIWWMTSADYVGFRLVLAVEEDPRLKGIRSKVTWWSN